MIPWNQPCCLLFFPETNSVNVPPEAPWVLKSASGGTFRSQQAWILTLLAVKLLPKQHLLPGLLGALQSTAVILHELAARCTRCVRCTATGRGGRGNLGPHPEAPRGWSNAQPRLREITSVTKLSLLRPLSSFPSRPACCVRGSRRSAWDLETSALHAPPLLLSW